MKKILFGCCALILGFLVIPAVAGAAERGDVSLTPASSSTDVGMVFYKMIGAQPDFDSWVTSESRYRNAPPDQQAGLLATERTKLEIAFNALDVKKTPLVVRTAVNLKIASIPGDTKRNLEVTFPAEGNVYFPYTVGGQNISIIPNGIDLYRRIPLTSAEAASIQGRLNYNGSATMVVEIVPVKADGSQPMRLDGIDQWLMIGEIGFIGFYNNSLEVVWSFHAPWYIRKGQQDLFNLHGSAGNQDTVPAQ
jgi:hypothetical protein